MRFPDSNVVLWSGLSAEAIDAAPAPPRQPAREAERTRIGKRVLFMRHRDRRNSRGSACRCRGCCEVTKLSVPRNSPQRRPRLPKLID